MTPVAVQLSKTPLLMLSPKSDFGSLLLEGPQASDALGVLLYVSIYGPVTRNLSGVKRLQPSQLSSGTAHVACKEAGQSQEQRRRARKPDEMHGRNGQSDEILVHTLPLYTVGASHSMRGNLVHDEGPHKNIRAAATTATRRFCTGSSLMPPLAIQQNRIPTTFRTATLAVCEP